MKYFFLFIAVLMFPVHVLADVVTLKDGSRIQGNLVSLQGGVLVFETAFAGQMRIDASQVASFGEPLEPSAQIAAVAVVEDSQASEEVSAPQGPDWSGSIAVAFNGSSGNTEEQNLSGKAEVKRETDIDRARASLQGRYERDDGEETENEFIARLGYERDFSDRLFGFTNASFEQDEFEELDLRANVIAGLGYFVIKSDTQTWKPRFGLGYEFESFSTDDGDENNVIVNLGYDYEVDAFDLFKFTHVFDYIPSIDDPTEDFRIESDAAALFPLGDDQNWNLELGLRNQFDNQPAEDVEDFDTYYSLGLKRVFD